MLRDILHLLTLSLALGLAQPTPFNLEASAISQLSPDIVNELKDFLDLISTPVIDAIVTEHYLTDSNFRVAFKYVRSGDFERLLQQVQQIPDVIEILDFLHLIVNDTTADATSTSTRTQQRRPQLVTTSSQTRPVLNVFETEFVLLRGDSRGNHVGNGYVALMEEYRVLSRPEVSNAHYKLRTFSSFVEELLGHLPRDRYVKMINEKRQKNAAFADFYAALRDPQLRTKVQTAMASANLAEVIKTLRNNAIDVNSLEPIAFNVISWGPPVAVAEAAEGAAAVAT